MKQPLAGVVRGAQSPAGVGHLVGNVRLGIENARSVCRAAEAISKTKQEAESASPNDET